MTLRDTLQAARRRVDSERGATITFALLVFMVCLILSAVILTAATASAGQFAELGQNDQRYYAVTSAVRLLEKQIKDEESACVVTQSLTGTYDARSATKPSSLPNKTIKIAPKKSGGSLGFFGALDAYAFAGSVQNLEPKGGTQEVDLSATLGSLPNSATWVNPWLVPFTNGAWTSATNNKVDLFTDAEPAAGGNPAVPASPTFTFTLSLSGVSDDVANAATVNANVRFHNNWTAEVVLYNANATSKGDRYNVYLLLAADANAEENISETLGVTDPKDGVKNSKTVTKEQKTTIEWHVEQMVPGRGL